MRLRHNVDQRRFARFDRINAPRDCRSQIAWVGNRPHADNTERLRKLRVLDVRLCDFISNMEIGKTTVAPVSDGLNMHNLAVISAIVVHDREHGNVVVGGRP